MKELMLDFKQMMKEIFVCGPDRKSVKMSAPGRMVLKMMNRGILNILKNMMPPAGKRGVLLDFRGNQSELASIYHESSLVGRA